MNDVPAEALPVVALRLADGRVGSTLLMQLLATSPEIVFDDRYPSEYRFLSYFRRVTEMVTEPFDEHRHRGVTRFFFGEELEFGPVPFQSDLVDMTELRDPLLRGMWSAWSEAIRERHPEARYYAEKLAVPVDDALRQAVPLRVVDLVRDPRDILCSIRSFTSTGQGDGFGTADQTGALDYAAAFAARVKAQLAVMLEAHDSAERHLVRYEDMVADLHGVADDLGEWLDVVLDADQVIADRTEYRRHITSGSVESSVGRWTTDMAEAEAEVITFGLRDQLEQLGYAT